MTISSLSALKNLSICTETPSTAWKAGLNRKVKQKQLEMQRSRPTGGKPGRDDKYPRKPFKERIHEPTPPPEDPFERAKSDAFKE